MRLRRIALTLAVAAAAGCSPVLELARGYSEATSPVFEHPPAESASWTEAQWGGFMVQAADLGLLTTDNLQFGAVPWKLFRVLPDVVPEPFLGNPQHGWAPDPALPFERFGLITGETLDGPKTLPRLPIDPEMPLGYVWGFAERSLPRFELQVAATSCTTCHASRSWDAAGVPEAKATWGIPNHSLDFDGLIGAVQRAATDPRASDAALLRAIRSRFPEVSSQELQTYRRYVIPAFKKGIAEDVRRWGSVHPWRFGGPGFSNGAAILRQMLSPNPAELRADEFGPSWVKIPNVYQVSQKPWLLIDGDYVARPEADQQAVFLDHLTGFLPVLGASPARAVEERPRLAKVGAFLESVELPAWPGPIDPQRAERGGYLYAGHCAGCHGDRGADGRYRYRPAPPVPLEEIGTDPARARAVDAALVRRFNATEVGRYLVSAPTLAYVAPPLHGVWAMAPYLHNGSIPTLRHLLDPASRPARFWSGGHALDLENVGIAGHLTAEGTWDFPEGYTPWSEPRLYDTREPGRSNAGHSKQVADLDEGQRTDLLEYLKTL